MTSNELVKKFEGKNMDLIFPLLLNELYEYADKTPRGGFEYLMNKGKCILRLTHYLICTRNILLNKVIEKNSAMERFLLQKAMDSFHFSVILRWFVEAETTQQSSNFLMSIERCTRQITSFSSSTTGLDEIANQDTNESNSVNEDRPKEEEIDEFEKVVFRQQYVNDYNNLLYFVNYLTDLSYRLYTLPTGPVRKNAMRCSLVHFNKILPGFHALYHPVIDSSLSSPYCEIKRILVEECICLETKARVSLLLVVEVIEKPERNFTNPSHRKLRMCTFADPKTEKVEISEEHDEENNDYRESELEKYNYTEDDETLEKSLHKNNKEEEVEGEGEEESEFDEDNIIDESLFEKTKRKIMDETKQLQEQEKTKNPFSEESSVINTKLKSHPNSEGSRKEEEEEEEALKKKRRLSYYDEQEDFVIVTKFDDEDMDDIVKEHQEERLNSIFGEPFDVKQERIKKESLYCDHPHWSLRAFIVKSNDDLRQEHMTMQFIRLFQQMWCEESKLPVHLTPYSFVVTSEKSGLVEVIRDAVSLHGLMKHYGKSWVSLLDYWTDVYGPPGTSTFLEAQRNFIESMAANSVICHILQVKDRHNGNLMITREGYVVHIDFGFLLGNSPGGAGFETAPFKLTKEFVEVIGGKAHKGGQGDPKKTDMFDYFTVLVHMCLKVATRRSNVVRLINLLKSLTPMCFRYPCVSPGNFKYVLDGVQKRLLFHLDERKRQKRLQTLAKDIIKKSVNDIRTKAYDQFQYLTNSIYYGD